MRSENQYHQVVSSALTRDVGISAVSESVDTLLPRAVAGDRQALASLLEDLTPGVRAALRAELKPAWRVQIDLDDLLQVTYLEAFLRIGHFNPEAGTFHAWLVQIGRNNLRDAIKELSRAKRPNPHDRLPEAQTDSCVALLDVLSASTTRPDLRAARAEMVGLMKSALRTLPGSYQRVVEMFDLQGQPAEQIASALGRSPGAVYMLRARAHDRLREVLGFSSPLAEV